MWNYAKFLAADEASKCLKHFLIWWHMNKEEENIKTQNIFGFDKFLMVFIHVGDTNDLDFCWHQHNIALQRASWNSTFGFIVYFEPWFCSDSKLFWTWIVLAEVVTGHVVRNSTLVRWWSVDLTTKQFSWQLMNPCRNALWPSFFSNVDINYKHIMLFLHFIPSASLQLAFNAFTYCWLFHLIDH